MFDLLKFKLVLFNHKVRIARISLYFIILIVPLKLAAAFIKIRNQIYSPLKTLGNIFFHGFGFLIIFLQECHCYRKMI